MRKNRFPFPTALQDVPDVRELEDAFSEFSYAYQRRQKFRVPYVRAVTRLSGFVMEHTGDAKGTECRKMAIPAGLIAGEQEIPLDESVALTVRNVMMCVSHAISTLHLRESGFDRLDDDEKVRAQYADTYQQMMSPLMARDDMNVFLDITEPTRSEVFLVLRKVMAEEVNLITRKRPIEGIDHPRRRIPQDVARAGDYVYAPLKERLPLPRKSVYGHKYYSTAEGIVLDTSDLEALLVLDKQLGAVRCSYKGLKVITDNQVAENFKRAEKVNSVRRLLEATEPIGSILEKMQEQE